MNGTGIRPALARTAALALALALLVAATAPAETLKSKLGYFVELPAGFRLASGDGVAKCSFVDPEEGMEFDIVAYDSGRYPGVADLAKGVSAAIGSTGDSSPYRYEGREAIFAELSFGPNDQKKKGFAVYVGGRKGERSYALLAFASERGLDGYVDFILSCLDSFSIDRLALRSPGPVSQFALAWPAARGAARPVSLAPMGGPEAGRSEVALPWSEEEAAEEAGTVDREYRVLRAYADEPKLYRDAWARFYRMAYRESASRLDLLALEASRLLPRDDPTETARRVLAWTQRFAYERDLKGSDFVAPLAAAYGSRGDCDSRAVVAAALLQRLGIDAILMVSAEYKHALLGVDVPGGGQRFPFGGKSYLVGETTAAVGLGMVAADQADWSKWMGIALGL